MEYRRNALPQSRQKSSARAPFLWVIKLNERASAIVVYVPGEMEQPVAAPWFEETD
jgi:hypothetical protein